MDLFFKRWECGRAVGKSQWQDDYIFLIESLYPLIFLQTPLHLAVITEQPELVALLLEHRASPLIPDRNGQTCVHLACEYGSIRSLEVLMRAGVRNLEATNYHGVRLCNIMYLCNNRYCSNIQYRLFMPFISC